MRLSIYTRLYIFIFGPTYKGHINSIDHTYVVAVAVVAIELVFGILWVSFVECCFALSAASRHHFPSAFGSHHCHYYYYYYYYSHHHCQKCALCLCVDSFFSEWSRVSGKGGVQSCFSFLFPFSLCIYVHITHTHCASVAKANVIYLTSDASASFKWDK